MNQSLSTATPDSPLPLGTGLLSLKDAFDIYQKQGEGVHKLWAYFQVISIAVLGYTLGTEKAHWHDSTYLFVAGGYAIFAFANQWVLVLSQSEARSLSAGIAVAKENAGPLGRALRVQSISPWKVSAFHCASIAIVLGAIYATWDDKCPAPNRCPAAQVDTKKAF